MGYLSGYDDDMGTVLAHVRAERFRQEDLRKSGKFSHTCATPGANNDKCNTILGEEVGEAAKALNDGDIPGLRTELVQVAAVAVAWVERLDAEARMPTPALTPEAEDRAKCSRFLAAFVADGKLSQFSADSLMRSYDDRFASEAGEAVPLATKAEVEALQLTRLAEATKRQATPERYAALGDSYDFIESMIEERTAANPQFPEMLAEAVKRREQVHQLARDAAKLDFIAPPLARAADAERPVTAEEAAEAIARLGLDPEKWAAETRAKAEEKADAACDLQLLASEPGNHRHAAFADVLGERLRQIAKGYNEEHDDSHGNGSIAAAAIAFTAAALGDGKLADAMYPFGLGFVVKPDDSPRALLVKAAALLIAEIERRDRAAEDRGANAADMDDGPAGGEG